MTAPPYLAVARFAKPHGLKGEAIVFALTDRPEAVFVPGEVLTPIDEAGEPTGESVTIARARPYHRRWLVHFEGITQRSALEGWGNVLLGLPVERLVPPGPDELYDHEVPGTAVVIGEEVVATARELMRLPTGDLLAVEVENREVLIPFRPPIVVRVDRERRRIVIDPPAGLLEL